MSTLHGHAFLGTRIAVISDLPAVTTWLDEFLTPGFDLWTGPAADCTVRIVNDAAAYDALARGRPTGTVGAAPCFALDQETVCLPAWGTVIADEAGGVFYVLDGTRVDVIGHPASPRLRTRAMRVVREIAAAHALIDTDRLQLHAAGLERDRRALLIAGPKGAGKTTLLASLAAAPGVRLLTNDRAVLVATSDGGFVAHGIPTIVNVRPGTLTLLSGFALGIPAVERAAHLTLAEADVALARYGSVPSTATLELSPPQLARQLGVPLSRCAGLYAVAFPEPHPDPDGLVVEHLGPPEVEVRLRAARFGGSTRSAEATVFEQLAGARRPECADDALVATVAARVAGVAIRIGARRLSSPDTPEAVLSAVL